MKFRFVRSFPLRALLAGCAAPGASGTGTPSASAPAPAAPTPGGRIVKSRDGRFDGEIVGTARYETQSEEDADTAWIGVYVLPEFQSRGIGRALAEAVEELSRAEGRTKVVVYHGVQAGEGENSTEEYGVILAASLSNRALEENRAAGLVAYGTAVPAGGGEPEPMPTLVMPRKGRAQQWLILRALALVRAGGRWPLQRVLAEMDRNLGRGTILAVITPSLDPSWVSGLLPPMRRGVAPTVLLLDPATFGGEGDATPLIALLADLGVPAERIVEGMPFRPVVEHKPRGRPELKVLPGTGRVIVVAGNDSGAVPGGRHPP